MFQTSKTFAASLLAMALMGGCASTSSQAPENSLSSMDNSRNVVSFADTLDSVLPSVVRIGTVKKKSEGKIALSGIGSSAVIDAEKGYVITNAHVVAGAEGVLINLPDGRTVQARVAGIDTPTDIAVLQADVWLFAQVRKAIRQSSLITRLRIQRLNAAGFIVHRLMS